MTKGAFNTFVFNAGYFNERLSTAVVAATFGRVAIGEQLAQGATGTAVGPRTAGGGRMAEAVAAGAHGAVTATIFASGGTPRT
jgi:hypothetical protein